MGKGDTKSKKGKRWRGSYGKKRNSRKVRNKKKKKENQKRIEFGRKVEKIKMLNTQFDLLKLMEDVHEKKLEPNPNNKDVSKLLKNINQAQQVTLELMNKHRDEFIGYSVEEIFVNNGQFDRFVSIEFHAGSEAFNKFGSTIMGTFIFTQFEVKSLKKHIGQTKYPRTSKNMRFEPSKLCDLDDTQIGELKKIGFNNKDIKTIYKSTTRYENRYKKAVGFKEIPGTIEIKIKDDGYDYGPMLLKLYESRIKKNSFPLILEEYHKYLALKLNYNKDGITEEEKTEIYEKDNVTIKPNISDIYIDTKYYKDDELNEKDKKIFENYLKRKTDIAKEAVDKEIQKSSSDAIHKIIGKDLKRYMKALMLAAQFEPENLSTYGATHSVRLGLEAFLHVVLRHCQGYQFGDWDGKRTTFEYRIKDVIRILKIIIENCQKEIDIAIDKGNDFQLVKGTSYLYDGNYYSIHIDKNGDLISFHPRNK
tara:strand:- start:1460 stop:2890 length:1431 start_codon:yes stop_codon:yes gene_type:complete